MNLLTYILAATLIILTVIQIFWDHLLKFYFKDRRTQKHKKLRKNLLVVSLVIFISNQIFSQFEAHQKSLRDQVEKTELNKKISELNVGQTNLINGFSKEREALNFQITNLTAQISIINSNQNNLSEENLTLLNELSTNSSISIATRQNILNATRNFNAIDSQVSDLNRWRKQLRQKINLLKDTQKLNLEQVEENQNISYGKNLKYYDYAIRTLTDLVGKFASQKEDVALSDFQGLPLNLGADIGQTNVANIKFKANPAWSLKIFISNKESNGRRPLRVYGCNENLMIFSEEEINLINTYLYLTNNLCIEDHKPIAEYKQTIKDALEYFLAEQDEEVYQTNR